MDMNLEDSFMVYVRMDPVHACSPDDFEQALACCASYEDALRVQRAHRHKHHCVIRYLGACGGGD